MKLRDDEAAVTAVSGALFRTLGLAVSDLAHATFAVLDAIESHLAAPPILGPGESPTFVTKHGVGWPEGDYCASCQQYRAYHKWVGYCPAGPREKGPTT